MSQQMHPDEEPRGYQAAYSPPINNYEGGPTYQSQYTGMAGQKLGQQTSSRPSSVGARLALAIVSVVMLVPLSGILVGNPEASIMRYMALAVVCVTIVIINLLFNLKRSW